MINTRAETSNGENKVSQLRGKLVECLLTLSMEGFKKAQNTIINNERPFLQLLQTPQHTVGIL